MAYLSLTCTSVWASRRSSLSLVPFLRPCILSLAWVPLASAQEIKLNGPLVRSNPLTIVGFGGGVDGRQIFVWGDLETDEVLELFRVEVSGLPGQRVNGPLAAGGDVGGGTVGAPFEAVVALDSRGDRIVYAADQEQDGRIELFSAKTSGGPTIKLNGTLVSSGDIAIGLTQRPFQITPDGRRVLYLADQDADEVFELYGIPIDGRSAPVRLNAPLVAGGDVLDFRISPDSQRVVYRADQRTDNRFELFGAPTDGSGPPSNQALALAAGGDVSAWSDYEISSDSRFVVYRGDLRTDGRVELFSAALVGSRAGNLLSGQLVSGGDVQRFSIVPDTSAVVYLADQRVNGKVELLRTPIDGRGPQVVLNAPVIASGDVVDFAIAPHGGRVVYRADQAREEAFELFSARLDDSSTPVRLNAEFTGPRDIVELVGITPDGTRVLYRGDELEDDVFGLFSAPILGDAPPVELSAPLVAGGDVAEGPGVLSPDGSRVVYLADREVDGVLELFGAPTDGSSPSMKLNLPLDPGREILPVFALTADGANVLYQSDHERDGQHELHAVSLDGGQPASQITHTPQGPIVGDVFEVVLTPDGTHAVYRADQDEDQVFELYSVATEGGDDPVKLNPELVAGGSVGFLTDGFPHWDAAQISPDGTRVVYHARQESSRTELFSIPVDGSAVAVKLNGPLVGVGPSTPAASSTFFAISPDSSRVIYLASQLSSTRRDLFGVAIDGQSPAVRLNGAGSVGSVSAFALSPDGSRVAYIADETLSSVHELFSVPLDGSSAPVRLHVPFTGSRDVVRFARSSLVFTPDGSRVLYLADPIQDGIFELFSVQADGSGTPIQLSSAQLTGEVGADDDLRGGALSDSVQASVDGLRVVFAASGLFSRAVDGSTSAIRLHPPLVPLQSLRGFQVGPAAPIVVFELESHPGLNRLYSAPDDGSAPPIELSRELPDFLSLFFPFYLVLGGTRAVFLVSNLTILELHSIPVDGSSPSVRLSFPSSTVGNNAVISPDGNRVLYLADSFSPDVPELLVAPIDGSSESRRVNSPLLPGRGVGRFFQASLGDLVLYTASRDVAGVFELFANSSALARSAFRAR